MNFGYIREWEEELVVSTAQQRLSEFLDDPRFLFSDIRGKNFERNNYLSMRSMLKAGDVLFLDGLDSLGSSAEDIVAEWRHLTREMQVDIVVVDETFQMDSRKYSSMGKNGVELEEQLLNMLLYATVVQQRYQMEYRRISTLVKPQKNGRPSLNIDPELFHQTAKRWVNGEITIEEGCELTGIGRSSWYNYTRGFGYVRNNIQKIKEKPELFHKTAQRWVNGEITVEEGCEITGIGRSSWYKYTRALGYVRNNKRTAQEKDDTN